MSSERHIREVIGNDDVNIVKKGSGRIYAKIIYYFFGVVLSLTFLFPVFYMFACSTKDTSALIEQAGTWKILLPDFTNPNWFKENYVILFTERNFGRYALNSLGYAAIVIVLNILINGLAAYAICKLTFPGKRFFNFIIMFLIIVPVETTIIPLHTICKHVLGLANLKADGDFSIFAVILPSVISIFNIFLFIQFFSSIPKEFEEAARMDGANTIMVFFKVILPLSKPILATVAVFCFIGVWNDYLWPSMVLENEDLLPIQSALTVLNADSRATDGQKMASLVTTSIPIFIVYIAAQKYIVKGFGAGGLKL